MKRRVGLTPDLDLHDNRGSRGQYCYMWSSAPFSWQMKKMKFGPTQNIFEGRVSKEYFEIF